VTDQYHELWSGRAVTPTVPVVRIRDLPASAQSRTPSPTASPTAPDAHCRRGFVNDARNSRLAQPLGDDEWRVVLHVPIDATSRASHVLFTADRAVLESEGPWQLLDLAGRTIARGYRDGGSVTLDPEHDLLFCADTAGSLRAHRLRDGVRVHSVPLTRGRSFERRFVARSGSRLLVVSRERQLDPHATAPADATMLEVTDLGDPPRADADGFLLSAVGQGDLLLRELNVHVALQGDEIVLASRDRVVRLGTDLAFRSVLADTFEPVAMSLDETGCVHLLVRTAAGVRLWLLTPSGERTYDLGVADEFGAVVAPPVVAWSHATFLLAERRILAVGADGVPLWECRTAGAVAGGTVAADDQLLVAAGCDVLALPLDRPGRVLQTFDGEQLRTPPVLTPRGELWVAGRRLHRLVRGHGP
jgi:hypothetical protein